MHDLSLSQILQARLNLTLAQSHLPGPLRNKNTTLISWLDALSVGPALVEDQDDADTPRLDFEAAVTADFRRLTWRAAGPPSLMGDAMRQFFAQVAIGGAAAASLEIVAAELEPAQVGAWIEAIDSDVDTGWYIPADVDLMSALEVAQTLAPESQIPDKVAAWAGDSGATRCVRIAHSVAPGNPFTEVRIILPGQSVDEWVLAGVRLFDALGITDLPDETLGALLNATTDQMVASVWFTPRGVVKSGILVANPELDLTLALFRMATGVQRAEEYSPLAEYQGNLQVEGPAWVEAQQRANGFGVEYHYTLPA